MRCTEDTAHSVIDYGKKGCCWWWVKNGKNSRKKVTETKTVIKQKRQHFPSSSSNFPCCSSELLKVLVLVYSLCSSSIVWANQVSIYTERVALQILILFLSNTISSTVYCFFITFFFCFGHCLSFYYFFYCEKHFSTLFFLATFATAAIWSSKLLI